MHLIYHARRCGHQIQIVFPLQTFLDHLQMQEPQKAAAEAEAKRHGGFRLVEKGGVV